MRRAAQIRLTVCMSAVAALAALGTVLAPAAVAADTRDLVLPPQPGLNGSPAPSQVPGVPMLGRKWG